MAVTAKVFEIVKTRSRGQQTEAVGTLEELIQYHAYTLDVGACYAHEKGNKKINIRPATIKSLVSNLNNAANNAANNGYSGTSYELVG